VPAFPVVHGQAITGHRRTVGNPCYAMLISTQKPWEKSLRWFWALCHCGVVSLNCR